MANLVKNIALSTDLDQSYIKNELIDIFGDVNDKMVEAEEIVEKKLTDSDEHVPSSRLIKQIFSDILKRLRNIEIWMESQWAETTLTIDNVDSIDRTEVENFYLN